jgi:hypothetical protein
MIKYNVRPKDPTPESVVRDIAVGFQPTDDVLLGVLMRLDPPLFSENEMIVLSRELDPKAERRGRPKASMPTVSSIAKKTEGLSPNACALPREFIDLLVKRLISRRRYTKEHSMRDFCRASRARERVSLIRGLYHEFYRLMDGDPHEINQEVLGPLKVPSGYSCRSERALALAHKILAEQFRMNPPSRARMRNIISEDPWRKRRPRT